MKMPSPLLLAPLLAALLGACSSAPAQAPRTLGVRPVLLVLDLQQDYLGPEPKLPVAAAQVDRVKVAAKALVTAFRLSGRPVVYIHNAFPAMDWPGNWSRNGATVEGTEGTKWVGPSDEPSLWVAKRYPDAFSEPALEAYLKSVDADSVVIAGVFGDPWTCVPSTAAGAQRRGYGVTVPYDGVGTATEAGLEPALGSMAKAGLRVVHSAVLLGEL